MREPEFKSWLKTPRLDSPFVITEKLDGTNSCVLIEEVLDDEEHVSDKWTNVKYDLETGRIFKLAAQSRNRLITPKQDNYGFAKWVFDNSSELIRILGEGRHYGEWWGGGIQRGYGLTKDDKRFSLFNISRYNPLESITDLYRFQAEFVKFWDILPSLDIVPVMYWEEEDTDMWKMAVCVDNMLEDLKVDGSRAVPDFDRPEGVVLYHKRSDQIFKKYVDPDEKAAEVKRR